MYVPVSSIHEGVVHAWFEGKLYPADSDSNAECFLDINLHPVTVPRLPLSISPSHWRIYSRLEPKRV
jgi:hypothetical protein